MDEEIDFRNRTWVDDYQIGKIPRHSSLLQVPSLIPNSNIVPPEKIGKGNIQTLSTGPSLDATIRPPEKISSFVNEAPVDEKKSFNQSYQEGFFGKNAGAIDKALDVAGSITNSLPGARNTYDGPKGHIRASIDQGYNAVADVASKFGPYGQIVSMGMKAANMLNGIQGAIFGATDGMTTTDAIMDSPLGFLTGVGWVNQAFGKKADTITKNEEAFAQVGSSYGGSNAAVDNALDYSGKKYGAFSSGARKDANALIAESRRQQNMVEDISSEATTRRDLLAGMSSIASNRRALAMQGGYNQSAIHVGRHGMVIAKRVTNRYRMQEKRKQIEEFKEGGSFNILSTITEIDIDSLPEEFKEGGILGSTIIKEVEIEEMIEEFKEGGKTSAKNKTLEELIEYAKQQNPRFIQRISEPVRYVDLGDGFKGTHRLAWATTDKQNEAVVYPEIFENENGELIYDPEHAFDNAKKGDALIMTPEEAEIFTKGYKQGWPEFFQKFAEGGKFNVIPEGALHARLHHMENADNLTKKGIPVVSEKEGGELEQHAEIEKEEIILRLSLTKRLEELAKEDTDEAALEAGKILVEEILNNTVDNTNTLL